MWGSCRIHGDIIIFLTVCAFSLGKVEHYVLECAFDLTLPIITKVVTSLIYFSAGLCVRVIHINLPSLTDEQ